MRTGLVVGQGGLTVLYQGTAFMRMSITVWGTMGKGGREPRLSLFKKEEGRCCNAVGKAADYNAHIWYRVPIHFLTAWLLRQLPTNAPGQSVDGGWPSYLTPTVQEEDLDGAPSS